MKNFMKGKFKRVLAGLLSLIMMAGIVPTTVFAADNTISMSFGPAYQSDGTLICYHDWKEMLFLMCLYGVTFVVLFAGVFIEVGLESIRALVGRTILE